MREIDIMVGLLAAVIALAALARRLRLPYPIPLVVGGLALGSVPGLPHVALPPDLVLLAFLPPLLYSSALLLSWRDFRANLGAIGRLAIGLVLATAAAVALVAHALVPGLPWAAAAVLGAIVAPTDAVASSAVAQQLRLPRRLITILEGESLVNDATSLVLYRLAVAAAATGAFSALSAGGQFLWASLGGVGIGLAAGGAVGALRRRLPPDPTLESAVSLLTPFAAYLPAEALHASGVLAVLALGLYLGRLGPRFVTAPTRLLTGGMWRMVDFLLNGLLFILVGLQLRPILDHLPGRPSPMLLLQAAAVSLTVVLVRFGWVFAAICLPALTGPQRRERAPGPFWPSAVVLSWAGMRGSISLAAALALPLTVGAGSSFPQRGLLIFLTFSVILVTLVAQGITLGPLITRLDLPDDGGAEREATRARLQAARAALARLEEVKDEDGMPAEAVSEVREHFQRKFRRLEARCAGDADGDGDAWAAGYRRLMREMVAAERQTVVGLRDDSVISDDVLQDVQRLLDLEEQRLTAEEEAG